MTRVILAALLFLSAGFLPIGADAATAARLAGSIMRGTVTDQGDCTNIDGKLLALYRSPTSEGVAFVFDNARTRVMPRWVAPADGQTVFVVLGGTVSCVKSNGSSREERRAVYYSVSGAHRAAQTIQEGGGRAAGSPGQTNPSHSRTELERLFPSNNRHGVSSPYLHNMLNIAPSPGFGGGLFMNQNFGGVNQQVIENADVSGSEFTRTQAQ